MLREFLGKIIKLQSNYEEFKKNIEVKVKTLLITHLQV